MLPPRYAAAFAVVLAAFPATDAAAAQRVDGHLEAGPTLVPGGYAWGEIRQKRARVLLTRGGSRRTVFQRRIRRDPLDLGVGPISSLVASRDWLAFINEPRNDADEPVLLYAGRLGRKPRLLRRCPEASDAALSGSLLATVETRGSERCPGDVPDKITIRDLAGGGSTELPVRAAEGFGGVSIAGRYVAYGSEESDEGLPDAPGGDDILVVYDRETRSKVLRTSLGAAGAYYDLGEDGTVVYMREGKFRRRLYWSSISQPDGRLIAPRALAAEAENVALAGARVAYERKVPGGTQVVISRLSGGTRVVARLRRGRRRGVKRVGDIAFDGRRIAWGTQRYRRLRRPKRPRGYGETKYFKHAPARIHVRRVP